MAHKSDAFCKCRCCLPCFRVYVAVNVWRCILMWNGVTDAAKKQQVMDQKDIKDTDILRIAKELNETNFIDKDILVTDMAGTSIPVGARRMNFILITLCTDGEARYTVDTQEQTVKKNDVIIISERHVVANYESSPDIAVSAS